MPKKKTARPAAPGRDKTKPRTGSKPGNKAGSRRAPAGSGGGSFKYRERSAANVRARGEQQGGGFDSMFDDKIPKYKVKKDNRLRILPPTYDGAEHYGIEVYVNYGIGPDGERYLSLSKMQNKPDPIAEELVRAQREGEDEEYIRDLKPKKRVLVYVIDRDDETAGPMLWDMPWTVDRDIALQCVDKRTNKVTYIDHPDEGYDIEFTKSGSKKQTEYHGFKVDRNPSPISDDPDTQAEWLAFITENPLPDVLRFFDYDHIKAKLEAGAPAADDDADDDQPKTRRGADKGKGKGKGKADPEPEDDEVDDEWEEDPDEVEDAEEEPEEENPAKGDRVWVDEYGEDFPGIIKSVKGEKASVAFDDGDTGTYPLAEVHLLADTEEAEDEEEDEEEPADDEDDEWDDEDADEAEDEEDEPADAEDDEWEDAEDADEDEDEAYEPAKGDRVEVDYDGDMYPGTVLSVNSAKSSAMIKFDDGSKAAHGFDGITLLDE